MGLLEAVTLDWLAEPSVDISRLVELADDLAWSGVEHLVDEGIVAPGIPAPVAAPGEAPAAAADAVAAGSPALGGL
jgi:hypothetical protein